MPFINILQETGVRHIFRPIENGGHNTNWLPQEAAQIEQFKLEVSEGKNPRDVKFKLGQEIVARFHGSSSAIKAEESFIARFQKGAMPENMPEKTVKTLATGIIPLANLLKEAGLTKSTTESRSMLKQGAVRIDGEVTSENFDVSAGTEHIIQVGKRRFAKVTATN